MKDQLRKNVVESMKHLGVYRDDFDDAIDIYVDMLDQYKFFEKQFAESGYKLEVAYTNKAGATNDRKALIYTAMETLRKDLAKYSDLLCLNPKAYERVKVPNVPIVKEKAKPESKLLQVLSDST